MWNYLNVVEDNGFQNIIEEDISSKLINQLVRRTILLKEFKNYIEHTDQKSVYHSYILGTREYIKYPFCKEIEVYEICSNALLTLYYWPIDL